MAKQRRQEPPDFIKNKPELFEASLFYWGAFHDLDTDRRPSMSSLAPIPWSAINSYALRYDLEGWRFQEFEQIIKAMDSFYRGLLAKKHGS